MRRALTARRAIARATLRGPSRALVLGALLSGCGDTHEPQPAPEAAAKTSSSELAGDPEGTEQSGSGDPEAAVAKVVSPAGEEAEEPAGSPVRLPGVDEPGYVGIVVARETIDVAAGQPGEVNEVKVRIGDEVSAGDTVAVIDKEPIREARAVTRAELAAARADLREAKADLAEAKDRLERREELAESDTLSQEDLEAARFDAQKARAARDRAAADASRQRARLTELDRRLREAEITAPSAGTVGLRYADPGTAVESGTPIVRLVASDEPWLRFAVPGDAAGWLDVGAEVDVEVESLDAPLSAVVRQIAPQVDPHSRMILVEAEPRASEDVLNRLHAGLAARVHVAEPAGEAGGASGS